jgi:DNA-binding response OmpR family regulator
MRTLIVEDEKKVASFTDELEAEQHTVDVAHDGDRASRGQ